jgi:hypothetical protein
LIDFPLEIGDRIRKADGSSGTVLAALNVVETRVMFNLEVAGNHDFFVGNDGWLVHNSKVDQVLAPDPTGFDLVKRLDLTPKRNPKRASHTNKVTCVTHDVPHVYDPKPPRGIRDILPYKCIP